MTLINFKPADLKSFEPLKKQKTFDSFIADSFTDEFITDEIFI
jgi:hypothetical protein